MSSKIVSFVEGLGLPSTRSEALQSRLNARNELACKLLQEALGDVTVEIPQDGAKIEGSWSATCSLPSSCVILPDSAQDVSRALQIINFCQIRFAIRSGGHSPNPGWASIDQSGILIDLQRLNQVTVSDDGYVASLGPGGRWGDVYKALDPYGVSVIGGRIPHIGVGGLILGGGFFHFSGQYGMAADNVKNFQIVLADGTITNANAKENPDLFWALKGGGANFGIVTRFDRYTLPVHRVWRQVGTYKVEQAPALLESFAKWQETGASDVKATVTLIIGLETATVGLIYSESVREQPASFAPFKDIPPLSYAIPPANGTVLELIQILGGSFANSPTNFQRHDYRGVSSRIDAQLYKEMYGFWSERALAVYEATSATQTFVLQPISVNMIDQGIEKGGNAMGIARENAQWWTTLIDWEHESDDETVRAVSIATTERWRQLGEKRGLHDPFVYLNDAARDQNPLGSYGVENVAKLKAVSRKYDPQQIFQKLQNDGFLLSRSLAPPPSSI